MCEGVITDTLLIHMQGRSCLGLAAFELTSLFMGSHLVFSFDVLLLASLHCIVI